MRDGGDGAGDRLRTRLAEIVSVPRQQRISDMPSNYEFIQELGYLRIVVSSSITLQEMMQAFKDVADSGESSEQPRLWILPESRSRTSISRI
jgi:hypothetical protein